MWVKKYANAYFFLFTWELITQTKAHNYTYGGDNWEDKPIAFNGKEITYDELTFSWEEWR